MRIPGKNGIFIVVCFILLSCLFLIYFIEERKEQQRLRIPCAQVGELIHDFDLLGEDQALIDNSYLHGNVISAVFIFSERCPLFIYKDYYLVQLWLEEYHGNKSLTNQAFLLIFDTQGNMKRKIELNRELRIFSISSDGYILASGMDEDIPKLYIYKLTI